MNSEHCTAHLYLPTRCKGVCLPPAAIGPHLGDRVKNRYLLQAGIKLFPADLLVLMPIKCMEEVNRCVHPHLEEQ